MSNKKNKYIGGTPIQTRITYLQRDPKLLSLIYELSNVYGINPKLPLQRLMKEGAIDNAIQLYNIKGKYGKTSPSVVDGMLLSAFGELGLDDSYSNIESGRTKLKRNIPYGKSENINENNRIVYTAQADNNVDQLEILVAELAGIRNHFRNKYPKYTDEELDILSNAAFNMGIEATEKHIKNKTINLTQKGNYALSKELDRLDLERAYQGYGKIGKEIVDQIPGSTVIPKTIYDTYLMTPEGTKKFGGRLRYGWGGFGDVGQTDTFVAHEAYYEYPIEGYDEWGDPIYGKPYLMGPLVLSYDVYPADQLLKDTKIYNNMRDRISSDIERLRNDKIQLNNKTYMRYGGIRKKYPYGGNYVENNIPAYSGYIGWGTKVKPDNIPYSEYSADGEGIVESAIANYATTGLSMGSSIGSMIGTTIAPGIGTLIGGLLGSLIGGVSGGLSGSYVGETNKDVEELRRRNIIVKQKEQNRQSTINNMQNRYENDVAKIRTAQQNTFSGQSFYMKHGGLMKPRMKYNNGGTILPNSSDTAVAYGRTHEQVDPMTGETGITYGNAEVEGGGLVGNKELPGEVIQQTPNGDRIYSDSLYVPGTRATYAQIAKVLTDKKGVIEQEISTLQETLDTSLDAFTKSKLAKAKAGTATRNIEKLASKLNLKTGELAQVDAQLNDVFESQEQIATVLGLRNITPITARFGGYRPKYKFGIPEVGLITNGLSFIGNMITTGLSAKSNLAQLDFLSKLSVPKTNKVEAEYHTVDTSPYDEASRKMATETKRFNKWIEDNVSNPQVLRNQKRRNLINYYEGLSDINSKKSAYLSSIYDANRNARTVARNTNDQNKYQDALNEYNKNMQIANARMSINNQTTQNYMASINQLIQAIGSYGNQKMYIASLPKGVQNEFYSPTRLERMSTAYDINGLTPKHLQQLRKQGVNLGNMYRQFRHSTPSINPLEWINRYYLNQNNPNITLTI